MVQSITIPGGFKLKSLNDNSVIKEVTIRTSNDGFMSVFIPFFGGDSYVGDIEMKPFETNEEMWNRILKGGM